MLMIDGIPKELLIAAENRNIIPFIGAGFSKDLKLPVWDDIINMMAKKLDWNPEVMKTRGDYYQIAQYYSEIQKGMDGLKSDLLLKFDRSELKVTEESKNHSLLVELGAPIIYTTNWDNLIEQAYEEKNIDVSVIRTLEDIIKIRRNDPQIIKFHGDLRGSVNDWVFTERSYFDRMDFESALDLKFRSDILGKTVMFVGYSFSDINMRFLWHKLMKLKKRLTIGYEDYPKSYIVTTSPNDLQKLVFEKNGIEVINLEDVDPSKGMEKFLERLVKEVR